MPYFVDKDQSHVIGGLKATISNPNTSSEAKERAAERLQGLGEPDYTSSSPEPALHELGSHQIAGYRATLTSPCSFSFYLALLARRILRFAVHSQTLILQGKQNNTLARFSRRGVKRPRRTLNILVLPPLTTNTPSASSQGTKPLYIVSP